MAYVENESSESLEVDQEAMLDVEIGDSNAQKRAILLDMIDNKKKVKKKGILYIARVPPGMKPSHLKRVLSDFCDVERVWCTSTDKENKKSRRAPSEAWVEVSSSKKAKKVARLLHMRPMGFGRFKEDLWNMKYLKGVEWHHLSTQHLHKKKMREKRLQQHIADAKKTANFYLQQIEKQRHDEEVKDRKRKRGEETVEEETSKDVKRTYQQKKSVEKGDTLDDGLLMKLFSK